MATANDIIKSALRQLGAIASSEDPSSAETADALATLNEMIESWSNESLLVYADVEDIFTLVPSQQTYTWGSGGDFTTARPLKILQARLRLVSRTPNYDLPIEILNLDQWAHTSLKATTSSIPTALYYDDNYPLGNLNFWPTPTVAEKAVINSQKLLTSFSTSSDTVTLPPGYLRALKYNLAIDLAPEYGQDPSASIVAIATEAKAAIKRLNIKPHYLKSDAAALVNPRPYNWLTGE